MMERIETTTNVAGKMITPPQIVKLVETYDPNVKIKFKMFSWKSELTFKIWDRLTQFTLVLAVEIEAKIKDKKRAQATDDLVLGSKSNDDFEIDKDGQSNVWKSYFLRPYYFRQQVEVLFVLNCWSSS